MVTVRSYREGDARVVGMLIADTYGRYNLHELDEGERANHLGPFAHARSPSREHHETIARMIRAELVLVAEEEGEVVGVLRGRVGKLQSLFVRGDCHRQGIGRALVERFERACIEQGAASIRVAATVQAVPFYRRLGYVRSTGRRPLTSFEGQGQLFYQPMKKILRGD